MQNPEYIFTNLFNKEKKHKFPPQRQFTQLSNLLSRIFQKCLLMFTLDKLLSSNLPYISGEFIMLKKKNVQAQYEYSMSIALFSSKTQHCLSSEIFKKRLLHLIH